MTRELWRSSISVQQQIAHVYLYFGVWRSGKVGDLTHNRMPPIIYTLTSHGMPNHRHATKHLSVPNTSAHSSLPLQRILLRSLLYIINTNYFNVGSQVPNSIMWQVLKSIPYVVSQYVSLYKDLSVFPSKWSLSHGEL